MLLSKTNFVSFEIETAQKSREMSVRLWEDNRLVDVCFMECRRGVSSAKNQFRKAAKILDAVLEKHDIVYCGGVNVDVLKTLDKNPSSKNGLFFSLTVFKPCSWRRYCENQVIV